MKGKKVLGSVLVLLVMGLVLGLAGCGSITPEDEAGIESPLEQELSYAGGRPETFINSHPDDPTTSTEASFTYSCDKKKCAFKCKLDNKSWEKCPKTGQTYTGLSEGSHTFMVKAQNLKNGLWDKSPESYSWTITSVPGEGAQLVSAGYAHTCALTISGGVKCWGNNEYGQIGNGTNYCSYVPIDISGLSSEVSAISAGGEHTCALLGSGGLKCWGSNWYGQLGDGTTIDRNIPVDVSGLSSAVIAVSAGGSHTCALLSSGRVKCWGRNWKGQLGDGTDKNRNVPVDVSELSPEVSAVSAGGAHTCALLGSGGLKCWGSNWYGQLGDGTTIDRKIPVDVSGLSSGLSAVSAGDLYTCVLMGSGGVKCWGYNNVGQLGDGTNNTSNVPVDVIGF